MSFINPNQLSFNVDPDESDSVSKDQLTIEFDKTPIVESETPPVYPSVNLAKRAIHLSRAIESDMKVAQLNGLLHFREKGGASKHNLDVIEASIYPHRDNAQNEFDAAYGSIEDLVKAGFDRNEVQSSKTRATNSYLEFIKPNNKKARDKFRRYLDKKTKKDSI